MKYVYNKYILYLLLLVALVACEQYPPPEGKVDWGDINYAEIICSNDHSKCGHSNTISINAIGKGKR